MIATRFLPDEAATTALGTEIAARLKPGDLVTLAGDLGAGKTAIARAVIRGLAGDPGLEVPSPTFSLVQPYEVDGVRILHADLYRLASASELDELGLFDDPHAIVLVEWPERVSSLFARADLRVVLAIPSDGTGREATLDFTGGHAA